MSATWKAEASSLLPVPMEQRMGVPTALALAASGHEVVGTDYNQKLVATLNEGKTTFEDGTPTEPMSFTDAEVEEIKNKQFETVRRKNE